MSTSLEEIIRYNGDFVGFPSNSLYRGGGGGGGVVNNYFVVIPVAQLVVTRYNVAEPYRNRIGKNDSQFTTEIKKKSPLCAHGLYSTLNLFYHFTLLFCRVRRRNVPKFYITHMPAGAVVFSSNPIVL